MAKPKPEEMGTEENKNMKRLKERAETKKGEKEQPDES